MILKYCVLFLYVLNVIISFFCVSSREKKLLVGSDDYGRDLTGVQNLKKKHKRLEAELASHEPAIQAVQEAGEKLMDVSNLGVPEIEQVYFYLNVACCYCFFLKIHLWEIFFIYVFHYMFIIDKGISVYS